MNSNNHLPNQLFMSSPSRSSKCLTLQSLNRHSCRSIRIIYCSNNRNNLKHNLGTLRSHHLHTAAVKQTVRSTQLKSALQVIKATCSQRSSKRLTRRQVLIEAIINNSSRSNNHTKFTRKARKVHLAQQQQQQLRNHNQCTNQPKILKSFHRAPRRIALISITLSARVDLVKYGKSNTERHGSCLL